MDDYFTPTRSSAATATAVVGTRPAAPARLPRGARRVVLGLLISLSLVALVRLLPQAHAGAHLAPLHFRSDEAPASAGWGAEWLDDRDQPARVDPCLPVTYAVNLTDAPAGALAVVRSAVSSLAGASGLRFSYTGLTKARPRSEHAPTRVTDGPRLLIAWTPAGTSVDGSTDASGVTYTRATATPAGPVIVDAQIVINSARTFAEGGAVLHESLRLVLLHELGYAVGLRHVEGSGQVMGAVAHPWLSEYASGDRRGLAILGTGGCLPSPHQR